MTSFIVSFAVACDISTPVEKFPVNPASNFKDKWKSRHEWKKNNRRGLQLVFMQKKWNHQFLYVISTVFLCMHLSQV